MKNFFNRYIKSHSHKKQKDSLKTRAVYIKVCMVCWNVASGPKHRGLLQDMLSAKKDQPLEGDLHAVLNEIEADILQKYKKMIPKMVRLTSRNFQQKHSSYKCQFCTKVSASPRLVPQVYDKYGQNIKIKYLMCRIPIEMLEHYVIPNCDSIMCTSAQKL